MRRYDHCADFITDRIDPLRPSESMGRNHANPDGNQVYQKQKDSTLISPQWRAGQRLI